MPDKPRHWNIQKVIIHYLDQDGKPQTHHIRLDKYDILTWSDQGREIIRRGTKSLLESREAEKELEQAPEVAALEVLEIEEEGVVMEAAVVQEVSLGEAETLELGTAAVKGPICLHDLGCTTTCW